ncbi:MAG: extracellular solute-binding protein [Anaerolineae bacterium]
MRFFQRLFLIVLITTVLSLGAVSAQDQPVTLNLWMFLDNSGFLPQVVEAFHAQYPNITVQITDVPEGDYITKIDTAILAGEPPDIGFPYVQRWIKAGYLLSIDDAMAANNVSLDDFNAGAVSRNCMADGHVYCLGSFTGGSLLFYNKDLFDAAGVPYPSATEPMTIDEYADLANRLTVPSDNIEERVWGANAPNPWWFDMRDFFSEDGHTALGYVDDAATTHLFQVIGDMYASGNALTDADMSIVSFEDLLATGRVAMAVTDTVVAQPLLENAGIRWGAAPPPVEQAGDLPWVYTGSDELAAFSGSAHPEEAKLFVIFYGTEGNRIRFETSGDLPLNMKLAQELNWAGDSEGRQEMFAGIQLSRPSLFIPEWFTVIEPLSEAINLMVEDGLSAEEALAEMAPVVQDTLDETWETWDQIQ